MKEQGSKAKPYHVPAAPFRRLVQEHIDKLGEDFNESAATEFLSNQTQIAMLIYGPDVEMDKDRARDALSHFMRGGENVDFDIADRIVTRLAGPVEWLIDPELNEIYETANLAALDLLRPTCEAAGVEERSFARSMGPTKAARFYGVSPRSVSYALSNEAVA